MSLLTEETRIPGYSPTIGSYETSINSEIKVAKSYICINTKTSNLYVLTDISLS